MNIAELFDNAAIQWPERIAIIDKEGTAYSFSELRNLVIQQSLKFKNGGISAGDRVMVFVPMSIELYISVLALFYIGAVAVFLDEWVNKERMEICCKLAGCKGFNASFKIRAFALLSKELRKIPLWFSLPGKSSEGNLGNVELYKSDPGDTALITFTTGSTGIPKAANRTHAFLKAQFDALMPLTEPLKDHPMGPDMPMLPIVLLLNLGRGLTSVIADFKASRPMQFKPEKIWKQIIKHKIVSLTTSPYYAARLAESYPSVKVNLKRMMIGGAVVFPELVEKLHQKLPGVETVIVYGSTEAEPVSHVSGNELRSFHKGQKSLEGLLVGYPDISTQVNILPLDYLPGDSYQPLTTPEQIGEICVSGKHVLQGYIDNPEAERQNKIWVENKCWHRTGDAGYLNEKGQLFLLGRCNRIIMHQGKIYYPFLAEYFLQSLPGVICGTLVLKHEKIYAMLQLNSEKLDAGSEKEIHHYYPDAIITSINEMPMDPRHHSKIDYEKLEERQ